jgi:alpha-L-fucosidase
VGASEDYTKRFFEELPRSLTLEKLDVADWAALSKLAGFKYVVWETKHHAGFCMYDSSHTDYDIMNTPYGKDIFQELAEAYRREGIAVGIYFSPDDFHFLYRQGTEISRRRPGAVPLTKYGSIDVMFIDGPAEGLREVCWETQPEIVVTRGAMETPEQTIPGIAMDEPWEACLTMGTQWHYKPTNETYKSGTRLIEILIETRAKGGNLLLNIGPEPNGKIPIEQEDLLREIGLWNFINHEAVYAVRPWVITNEHNIWFTKKKDEDTVFAIVTQPNWAYGTRKIFRLRSVRATDKTEVSVLGQSSELLEYEPEVDASTRWQQTAQGLEINAMRAQRIYNDRTWPNPVVLKMTHVEPGLVPPRVLTRQATWDAAGKAARLEGDLLDLGNADSVEVGFQYRRKKRTIQLYEEDDPWKDTKYQKTQITGTFDMTLTGLEAGQEYEIRTAVRHPLITLYGAPVTVATGGN